MRRPVIMRRRVLAVLPPGSRGTFGILGNHDYGPSWAHPEVAAGIATAATEAGVRVLRNEVAEVDGLQIAGLDDLWANRFDPGRGLAGLDPRGSSLVLSHNSDTVDRPVWGEYAGWILCGHTHGGQCKPPFLPPLLPVRNRAYTAGEFRPRLEPQLRSVREPGRFTRGELMSTRSTNRQSWRLPTPGMDLTFQPLQL